MSINADVGGTSERFLKELEHISEPIQGAKELLLSLQGRCRLHVATNGLSTIQRGRLACFSGLFDEFFISEEMNVIKPKAEFFEQIFERLHAKKQDCLMIGDSLLSDMNGAYGVEMDGCWVNRARKKNVEKIPVAYEISEFSELLRLL
jgi:2-haloacid dehalogenase